MNKRLYLCPRGIDGLAAIETAAGVRPLAGGPLGFTTCEATVRDGVEETARQLLPQTEVVAWARQQAAALEKQAQSSLEILSARRLPFAGLDLRRPRIMGVINVTPDSFSDGGDHFDPGKAVATGLAMVEAGADILDIGGESTRPGAEVVTVEEELQRVIPVVRGLADSGAVVSIDTRHGAVMAAALAEGASIINDITAFTGDPEALSMAAESPAAVVLMHMQGEPHNMQANPVYEDAALDVYDFLSQRIAACRAAGIAPDRIAIDPGIGFGKTIDHNLRILDQLALYHGMGCALLLGVSRKNLIARLSKDEPPKQRMPGSLAAALAGVARGAQIVRVHDVAETIQAITVWQSIAQGEPQAAVVPTYG